MSPQIAFFGTPGYSIIVANALYEAGFTFVCVVTKPPRPVGRNQLLTPTPMALWSNSKNIPVILLPGSSEKPWLFADEKNLTADYTQKIPMELVKQTNLGGLNVHPSLLPAFRGPAPVPWAIFNGETVTGVSILTLDEKFDSGNIIAQAQETILPSDTSDKLLERLFEKGGQILVKILTVYKTSSTTNYELLTTNSPSYFPRLTREIGFEPWNLINNAILTGKEAVRIDRKWRAFHPWPGLWTKVKLTVNSSQFAVEKRLKILKVHLDSKSSALNPFLILDEVQLEGKTVISGKNIDNLLGQIRN